MAPGSRWQALGVGAQEGKERDMRKVVMAGILVFACAFAYARESPKIEAAKIEGFTEVRPGMYRIGEDLQAMAEWYPPEQYNAPRFFKEVVTKKYEEKKKELRDTVLKVDRLEEKSTIEGVKGCRFSLVGEGKEGQVMMEYHWLQVGNEAAKVMIMGNPKTYEANKDKVHAFLKSLKVK
jgi:hypothetical protein